MYKLISFFVLISLGSLTAQTFIGKLNPYPAEKPSNSFQVDTIKILGIMSDFQEDQDGATFGNGKFGTMYSRNYGNTILDPLPHDKAYFEAHLEFVKNYFSKVSRGKVIIQYNVLPDVITVSQTMRNYSPLPGSDDFTPLANYSKEVWTLAGAQVPGFNFSEYDIFTVFHAGVGRDVSLPGSIGNERDLPSVYLSDKALKEVLSDLTGLPVNREGKYNSMIIPETESRELQTFGGTFLFQLSINGLLAASVASHLGLPDLFNTETGLSAIGRFGLMDGQAIFAYSGTFPPEPSAWEKIFLGWEVPVTLSPGNYDIGLVTKVASTISDTVILKVPINSSEYYLVENRIRDANNDGAIVRYILSGDTLTKVFTKDTTGFQNFLVDSLAGVIIDVDEFDWAIPNARSVDNNVYNPIPGGGIVIWHIDENIINTGIEDNKINVDKNNRGIDVEEADGVQDIGERFFTIFGDEIIGEGFIEDYWHASNPARLYRNRFSKDTRPNTNSNSGANSLITFSDFSEIGNRMTFKVNYGDSLISPLFFSNLNLPSAGNRFLNVSALTNGDYRFNLIADRTLYLINSQGTLTDSVMNFSNFKPASVFWNNSNYVFGANGSLLNLFKDGILTSIEVGENISAPPVIVSTLIEQHQVLIGTSSGKVRKFTLDLDSLTTNQIASTPIIKIAADGLFYSVITSNALFDSQGKVFNFNSLSKGLEKGNNINHEGTYDLVLTKNKEGNYISIVLFDHDYIYVVSDGELISDFSFNGGGLRTFSVTDLRRDGENYILIPSGSVEARNLTGALADNFPFTDSFNFSFLITPLSADFYGDNKPEIISFSSSGNIYAVDASGKVVRDFPISAGQELACVPVLFNDRGKISVAVLTDSGSFSAWNIGPTEGTFFWSEEHGNNMNTSFIEAASKTNIVNEFFPKSRVYNYPNPVYESTTNIRYFVAEDSKINIKVFDLAGGFVAELNDDAAGGFDNETVWNVNDIQSGVYLARIEATSSNGKTESNIIKIAIVK